MDIKISEKVVGSLYVNIQFPIENFGNKKVSEIIDLIKGENGQSQQVFEIAIGKFKISSFRRIYKDTIKVCVEGAVLEAV